MAAEADRCLGLTEEVVIGESKFLFCYSPWAAHRQRHGLIEH